jgi:flagellin-like hook-associated protein FlgL
MQVQTAAAQIVGAIDNSATVFNKIKTGNVTFAIAASAAIAGYGLLGAANVFAPTTYAGGKYLIVFTKPTTAAVTPGTYTPEQSITRGGRWVPVAGQPAGPLTGSPETVSDTFTATPTNDHSVFTTVRNLITIIRGGKFSPVAAIKLSNAIAGSLSNIDQGLSNASSEQTSVGGRLNEFTTQQSVASSQRLQLQKSIASLEKLDVPAALTTLESLYTLSAVMQAYTLTQGLTLFKYIQ